MYYQLYLDGAHLFLGCMMPNTFVFNSMAAFVVYVKFTL